MAEREMWIEASLDLVDGAIKNLERAAECSWESAVNLSGVLDDLQDAKAKLTAIVLGLEEEDARSEPAR
jgi:hypothetical protein